MPDATAINLDAPSPNPFPALRSPGDDTARLAALEAELAKAPAWKRGTPWAVDREHEIDALRARLNHRTTFRPDDSHALP